MTSIPTRRYPLMVFLHGSASDETNLRNMTFLTDGGFIEVAPSAGGSRACMYRMSRRRT